MTLRHLNIELNSLKYINDKVLTKSFATSLRSLKLRNNDLQNIPTTAFQYLSNLYTLNLSYNPRINLFVMFDERNITIFPEALSNLKFLDLSYCNIRYFDDNVFQNLR